MLTDGELKAIKARHEALHPFAELFAVLDAQFNEIHQDRAALLSEVERLRSVVFHRNQHCENCGLTWIDDGLNSPICPYCEVERLQERLMLLSANDANILMLIARAQAAEREVERLQAEVGRLRGEEKHIIHDMLLYQKQRDDYRDRLTRLLEGTERLAQGMREQAPGLGYLNALERLEALIKEAHSGTD